jgi:hypothetical protein
MHDEPQTESLRRQMEQFFDATTDAIFFLDRAYNFVFLNRCAKILISRGEDHRRHSIRQTASNVSPSHPLFQALLFAVCLIFTLAARAQGGTPFITDDPETPDNNHFEINYGFIGNRTPHKRRLPSPRLRHQLWPRRSHPAQIRAPHRHRRDPPAGTSSQPIWIAYVRL